MDLTPQDGSLKLRIISLCMELPMSWKNFVMPFYIWILDAINGGNGMKIQARGMLHGPILLLKSMNVLTLTPTIYVV
jgi:hypothetical protein